MCKDLRQKQENLKKEPEIMQQSPAERVRHSYLWQERGTMHSHLWRGSAVLPEVMQHGNVERTCRCVKRNSTEVENLRENRRSYNSHLRRGSAIPTYGRNEVPCTVTCGEDSRFYPKPCTVRRCRGLAGVCRKELDK